MYSNCKDGLFLSSALSVLLCRKLNNMQQDEQLEVPEIEKNEEVDIDEKIDRLQKQNEAESIALLKLLHGLDKIEKSKIFDRDIKAGNKNIKSKI